jgi:GLPGLI family protein
MKKFIFIFILFQKFLFYSQTIEVTYLYTTPTNMQLNEKLWINNNVSKGFLDSIIVKQNEIKKLQTTGSGIGITSKISKVNPEFYYKKSNENTTFLQLKKGGNIYWVKDEIPAILWKTDSKEKKQILNYTCKKATADFRGSRIYAYYSSELPHWFGPYKFFGLPGLILEVGEIDNEGKNHWIAQKIKIQKENQSLEPNLNNKNIISFKDFILNSEHKETTNTINTFTKNLPFGVEIMDVRTVRKAIEKKYEWEK